jgi:hypothetical protein
MARRIVGGARSNQKHNAKVSQSATGMRAVERL